MIKLLLPVLLMILGGWFDPGGGMCKGIVNTGSAFAGAEV